MEYLYDTKTRMIKEYKDDSEDYAEEIKLSKLQGKLLMALSNGRENTWEEIIKYIYNEDYNKISVMKVKSIIKLFKNKLKINIVNLYGYGFMLTDHIYIK